MAKTSSDALGDVYLTIPQAAVLLQISERTLWELARNGTVPNFQVGKQYRFRRETLDDWAQRNSSNEGGAE